LHTRGRGRRPLGRPRLRDRVARSRQRLPVAEGRDLAGLQRLMQSADTALERRRREGSPIKVAMVGAGFMGRGIALQILSSVPGMRLVAIANRTLDKAHQAYREAGADNVVEVSSPGELEAAIAAPRYPGPPESLP